ncbi:SusC/RagA family TonB-linked outer membrane protein [Puteibacter caeruleilacunae]|nr:SusC/RagA family TonB-linked outer membrane protein [Puteibacter caeruleilacunae]
MKKKVKWLAFHWRGMQKILLIMRLTCFFMLLGLLKLSASAYSQQMKFNMNMKNVTLKEVFKQIENQSEFVFFYNLDQVELEKSVNLKCADQTIEQILDNLFENSDLAYRVVEQHVVLFPKESASGQQNEERLISGVVRDGDGVALPGVSVVIEGTITGVTTDLDGKYSIKVNSNNATLIFSFVGMKTSKVAVGNNKTLDVVLEADNIGMDEVVVTALGVRRDRKTLGYAISKVTGLELVDAGTPTNPIQSLYGKAAGVTIRQSASGPTGGININIRGAAGLQADAKTRPLFVVDGVPIFDENTGLSGGSVDYGTGINDINPDDIESIEILKGAKASVLYGSEGANGVVLITTKNGAGAMGKMDVNVSYQFTVEEPRSFIEFQNEYGSGGDIYDVKDIADGESHPRANFSSQNFGPAFDSSQQRIWWDDVARPYVARPNNYEFLFKNGSSHQVNTAISKSGEFGNVRFSYTNYQYDGIMDNFWQKKNTLSFSGKFNFSEKLKVEATTNLYTTKTHNRPGNTLGFFIDGVSRDAPFQEFIENGDYLYTDSADPNFGYKKDFEDANYPSGYYSLKDYSNFVWGRNNNSAKDDKMHLITTIRPTYYFTDWLYVVGQASLDYTDTDYTTRNSVTKVYPELVGGQYAFKRRNTKVQEYRGTINFYKTVMSDRLDIFAFAGGSYKKISENTINVATANVGSSSGFNYPNWYHLNNQNPGGWPGSNNMGKVRGNTFGENTLNSVFGVATLTLDNLYTLELNARNDWSSTLPPGNNSYFYPGVAFTYDATKVIRELIPQIQFGKFRTSWADVGRDAPSRYYAYNSFNAGVVEGTDANSVSVATSLFAGDLKPERKREIEFGTEMSFFKGSRLGIDFSYYTNKVYDQIMSVPLTASSGAREIKINAGEVKNWGYEIQLTAVPVLTKDMRWDMTFTTANQFSEVVKLYPGITEKNINSMRGQVYVKAKEGERIGNIYGHDIKRDPQGNRIVSSDGSTYALNDKEYSKLGNVHPNFIGGFNTSFGYKGFRVSAHFDYSFGASMYSETNQWLYYNGTSKQSLANRDEAHGGLAYYVDAESGENVAWQHSDAAPSAAKDGQVFHDGIILNGVMEVEGEGGNVSYKENNKIVPVSSYYGSFVSWAGESINAVDLKYKNDYIKLREISLSYTLPKSFVKNLNVSNVTLNLFARNLGYIHKTVPNLDAEAYMGTNSYFEASPIPSTRTMGFKLSVGF